MQKKTFNPVAEINNSVKFGSDNLLILLDAILHFMITQEMYANVSLDKKYLKFEFKKAAKEFDNYLNPIVSKDYGQVYKNGSETTLDLISEFEIFIRYIAICKVPEKKELQDLMKLYNKDAKLVASICKKILKKYDSRDIPNPSEEAKAFLNLLDYVVNLVFLENYVSKLKETHYNCTLIKNHINKILNLAKPILKKDFELVFKKEDSVDLIEYYRDYVSFLGDTKIDQKIVVSQLTEAYNINKKAILGIIK